MPRQPLKLVMVNSLYRPSVASWLLFARNITVKVGVAICRRGVGLENAHSACPWNLQGSCLPWRTLFGIRSKKGDGTHNQISAFLEKNHPGQRGFSVRSVEGFAAPKVYTKRHELTTTSWMRPYLILQTW